MITTQTLDTVAACMTQNKGAGYYKQKSRFLMILAGYPKFLYNKFQTTDISCVTKFYNNFSASLTIRIFQIPIGNTKITQNNSPVFCAVTLIIIVVLQ